MMCSTPLQRSFGLWIKQGENEDGVFHSIYSYREEGTSKQK